MWCHHQLLAYYFIGLFEGLILLGLFGSVIIYQNNCTLPNLSTPLPSLSSSSSSHSIAGEKVGMTVTSCILTVSNITDFVDTSTTCRDTCIYIDCSNHYHDDSCGITDNSHLGDCCSCCHSCSSSLMGHCPSFGGGESSGNSNSDGAHILLIIC